MPATIWPLSTDHIALAAELFIGLMSGTSLDGIDAVLVDFADGKARLLSHHYTPYSDSIRQDALALHVAGDNELHRAAVLAGVLAHLYGNAVSALLNSTGTSPSDVRAIGCHGQTLRHCPKFGYTLQLNNPAQLAEQTGIAVVADFRSRDLAAGGQGAPLVPACHDALFRISGKHRIILNLGGIANITNLAPGKHVSGFDCGPANMLLDGWISATLGRPYDVDGSWARSGKILPKLLGHLITHPFFSAPPPKSCGREQFNQEWLHQCLHGCEAPADVQATLVMLTARSVTGAILRWYGVPDELYVCGGGVRNAAILDAIEAELPGVIIEKTDVLGVPAEQVEAVAFAWLAQQALNGRPGNCPSVTGARGARILGAIYPA